MRFIGDCIFLTLALLLIPSSIFALAPYIPRTTGIDVSWPKQNCHIIQHTPKNAQFGIIGVNGGLDFTGNSCLLPEASVFGNSYSLYLNTGYPGSDYGLKYQSAPLKCSATAYQCLSYNYGFADAHYSIHYAAIRDVHTTHWWLDVENDNSWTYDTKTNVSFLKGMVAALKQSTLLPTIGYYAYPSQWAALTGNWHNNDIAWTATGTNSRMSALAACRETSFTGGDIILTQYTLKLDQDYAC